MKDNKNIITEILNDQKEIFGDYLFENLSIKSISAASEKTPIVKENKIEYTTNVSTIKTEENFWSCTSLEELNKSINTCTKCKLGTTRNKFVFGSGNPNADVMIIGEAPGADEDKQGEPFVGRAGKLLTDILKAINFSRDEVYIANILKCRPPNNRNPLPDEMDACTPYLFKQIELIKPKTILCLGLVAASYLVNKKLSLTKMRGNIYEVKGVQTMVTYHPAALLRNPSWKRGCWEDVQKFRKLYDNLAGNK
jgi:DNA polymerase